MLNHSSLKTQGSHGLEKPGHFGMHRKHAEDVEPSLHLVHCMPVSNSSFLRDTSLYAYSSSLCVFFLFGFFGFQLLHPPFFLLRS